MRKFLVLLFLLGCKRGPTSSTVKELETILGEKVTCIQLDLNDGWICKTASGKHYYCPVDKQVDCFYTSKIQILDPPVEKSNQ